MDAITYLLQEHSQFRKALTSIDKTAYEKVRRSKFEAFCNDLLRHETMEEEIWYPALRKYPELRDIIKHLIDEEKSAAKSAKKFKRTNIEIIWKLKFYKFKHDVDHHAREEEKELFPKVRKLLTKTELDSLGTQMKKFKSGLRQQELAE